MPSLPDPFHLVFYVFDLMHLNGKDLRALPLSERRKRLVELGAKAGANPYLFIVDQFDDGEDLMQWCTKYRLEGVVSKLKASPYISGECRRWVKSKCAEWKQANQNRRELFGQQPQR